MRNLFSMIVLLLLGLVSVVRTEMSSVSPDELMNQLKVQVDSLQRERDEDRAALRELRRRLEEASALSSQTVLADLQRSENATTTPANLIAAVESERRSLQGLDAQLTGLKRELTALVAAKDRDSTAAGEIGELRMEVDALRSELRKVKSEAEAAKEAGERERSARQQLNNSQATVKWLRGAVDELRGEIAELAAGQNVSVALARRQHVDATLTLLRSDLASANARLEEMRAGHEQHAAALVQLGQDATELRNQQSQASISIQLIRQEILRLKEESSGLSSQPNVEQHHNEETETTSNNGASNSIEAKDEKIDLKKFFSGEKNSHRHRHHHGQVRKDVDKMTGALKQLYQQHVRLEHEVQELRHNHTLVATSSDQLRSTVGDLTSTSQYRDNNWTSVQRTMDDTKERLARLEALSLTSTEAIHNLTSSMSGVDKLHTSTMQLFEALESLQDEYGKSIREIQKEVSKLEFNGAQLSSSFSILKEDQSSHYDSLKSAKKDLAQLRSFVDTDHFRLVSLQNEVLNGTLQRCRATNRELLQDLRLADVEDRLAKLVEQMDQGKNSMNTLNAIVRAKADLYHVTRWNNSADAIYDKIKMVTSKLGSMNHKINSAYGHLNIFTQHLPKDCSQTKIVSDEVALIHPHGFDGPLPVVCRVDADGRRRTLIQQRVDGKVDFYRNWDEYRKGFGDLAENGSFWLGNEAIHRLTAGANVSLRVDLWDRFGVYRYAEYREFAVDSEANLFRLRVGGYRGNASDALHYHNQMAFSTKDADHDASSTHCAVFYLGGWWYNHCQYVNVNGKHDIGLTWFDLTNHEWLLLDRVEMSIWKREDMS